MPQSFFASILGLSPMWRVNHARRAEGENCIELEIVASPGAVFTCPVCSTQSPVVCEEQSIWCHDNFFHLRARISAHIPLVSCETCGINRVNAPWEQHGNSSKFRIVKENQFPNSTTSGENS